MTEAINCKTDYMNPSTVTQHAAILPGSNPAGRITLLNAAILTSFGAYSFLDVSQAEAKKLVKSRGFVSAIGHAPTASLVSKLLEIECPMNRIHFVQEPGQDALIFRLAQRLPEGVVLLTEQELLEIGFSFGLLKRIR
jgi:hypothetical protein